MGGVMALQVASARQAGPVRGRRCRYQGACPDEHPVTGPTAGAGDEGCPGKVAESCRPPASDAAPFFSPGCRGTMAQGAPYRVYPGLLGRVTRAEARAILAEADARAAPIFNYTAIGANDDDRARRQMPLPDAAAPRASAMWVRMREGLVAAGVLDASVTRTAAVALLSEKGCQRQALHMDYDDARVEAVRAADPTVPPPRAALAAVMPDTRLVVRPDDGAGEHEVVLQPGDVLVFGGLLAHAGAAYPRAANVRLHAYIDSHPDFAAEGRTFLV